MKPAPMLAYGARVGEVPEAPCKPIDPLASVRVSNKPERARRAMFRRLAYGAVNGLGPVCRDSNHVPTQVDALRRRLCRKLPDIDPGLLAEFGSFVRHWLVENLAPLAPSEVLNFDQWIAEAPYTDARKAELRAVWLEQAGGLPRMKQARRVNAFIKTESYELSKDGEFKAARWICSRSDAAKVILGPWMKSIERRVYELPWFIKHVPVQDRWRVVSGLKGGGRKYIITDYTSFEASFASAFMENCECLLYSHMLQCVTGAGQYIRKVLTGKNQIRTRAGVSVELQGRRMSGDMNTSLGNGFSNLMLMLFFCQRLGTTVEGRVEGDDGVFALTGTVPTPDMFARLGFEIKLAEVEDPCMGGFCGVVAADGTNIRDPSKFLQGFGWSSSAIQGGEGVQMQLLRAKALSALYENPACPIITSIASQALDLTEGVNPRFVWDGYHAPPPVKRPERRPVSCRTRDLFFKLYGVTPQVQIQCEERIDAGGSLDFLTTVLRPHWNHSLYWNWFVAQATP